MHFLTIRHRGVRSQKHNASAAFESEHQAFTYPWSDLFRREIHHRNDLFANEVAGGVKRCDLRTAFQDTDSITEINP